jgi:hypothetical protein
MGWGLLCRCRIYVFVGIVEGPISICNRMRGANWAFILLFYGRVLLHQLNSGIQCIFLVELSSFRCTASARDIAIDLCNRSFLWWHGGLNVGHEASKLIGERDWKYQVPAELRRWKCVMFVQGQLALMAQNSYDHHRHLTNAFHQSAAHPTKLNTRLLRKTNMAQQQRAQLLQKEGQLSLSVKTIQSNSITSFYRAAKPYDIPKLP